MDDRVLLLAEGAVLLRGERGLRGEGKSFGRFFLRLSSEKRVAKEKKKQKKIKCSEFLPLVSLFSLLTSGGRGGRIGVGVAGFSWASAAGEPSAALSGASSLVPAATELTSTEPLPPLARGDALVEAAAACGASGGGGCVGGLEPIPDEGSWEWGGPEEAATLLSLLLLLSVVLEAAAAALLLFPEEVSCCCCCCWEAKAAARLLQGCAETEETPRRSTSASAESFALPPAAPRREAHLGAIVLKKAGKKPREIRLAWTLFCLSLFPRKESCFR